jgi:hypothetical protein
MKSPRRDDGKASLFVLFFLRPGHYARSVRDYTRSPVRKQSLTSCRSGSYPRGRAPHRQWSSADVPIQCQRCSIPDAFLLPRNNSPDLADIKRAERELVPCFFPRADTPAGFAPQCAPRGRLRTSVFLAESGLTWQPAL